MQNANLRRLIREAVNEAISKFFNRYVEDDMFEYERVWPKYSGLSNDIFVDDSGVFKRKGGKLLTYFVNGRGRNDAIVPIVVSDKPHIDKVYLRSNPRFKLMIPKSEYRRILDFVAVNKDLLFALANEDIGHIEFYKRLRGCISVKDNRILENPKLSSNISGLPVDIWVDEGRNPQHAPRIKFRASKEQKNTTEFSSMTIEDEPKVFNLPQKTNISNKDIEKIKKFVVNNKENLLKVFKMEMSYVDFISTITQGTTQTNITKIQD